MATDDRGEARIESIVVRLRTRDGSAREIKVDPDENDALFWSQEAVDKLALPFYLAARSLEQALAIRGQVDSQLGKAGLIIAAHKRLCTLMIADLSRIDPVSGL
ncbi:MAG: hypothetical protein ACREL3_05600 [Gemmatimonadales bacterium]